MFKASFKQRFTPTSSNLYRHTLDTCVCHYTFYRGTYRYNCRAKQMV